MILGKSAHLKLIPILTLQFYLFSSTNPKPVCNFSDKKGKTEIFLPKTYSGIVTNCRFQTTYPPLHIALEETLFLLRLIGVVRFHT